MAGKRKLFSSTPRERAEERAKDMASQIRTFNKLSTETRVELIGTADTKNYNIRKNMSDAALYRAMQEMRDQLTRINIGLADVAKSDMATINYAISQGYRPSEEVIRNAKLQGDFRAILSSGTAADIARMKRLYKDIERMKADEKPVSVSEATSIEEVYDLIVAIAEGIKVSEE